MAYIVRFLEANVRALITAILSVLPYIQIYFEEEQVERFYFVLSGYSYQDVSQQTLSRTFLMLCTQTGCYF